MNNPGLNMGESKNNLGQEQPPVPKIPKEDQEVLETHQPAGETQQEVPAQDGTTVEQEPKIAEQAQDNPAQKSPLVDDQSEAQTAQSIHLSNADLEVPISDLSNAERLTEGLNSYIKE